MFFFIWNLHTVYDNISNFMIISVHTENSYELMDRDGSRWIEMVPYNRIYFNIFYLHRDPIKTKALLTADQL